MKHLYILSGLGADERVFHKIDFTGYQVTHIHWIKPGKDESIQHFAARLCNQIRTPDPIIIGLSFGGLMAIEIAKQIQTEKVIIISSCKNTNELPFYFRLTGKYELHKKMPSDISKISKPAFILNWLFGAANEQDKLLLKTILLETNNDFFVWAIDKVVNWKNDVQIHNLIQIHGTVDKIFPIKNVKANIVINGGGHFMILSHAKEISEILRGIIE